MGNLREHEVHSAALLGLGFVPGEVHYLASQSQETYEFWRDSRRIPASRLHTSILDAYDSVGRRNESNNVIVVSPDSHTLAAALVFDKNMTHVVGDFPPGLFAHRARFGMSTTFTPMITVSGSGNYFKNFYLMHGTAVGDYISCLVSGNRNVFENVHFAGPMVAAQGGGTGYLGVHVTGSENYFKNCVFGSKGIARDEVTPNLKIAGGDNVFENCWFVCQLTDTDPIFVYVDNATSTNAWFKGCQFLAWSPNHAVAMAVAFVFGAGASADITLDPGCSFHNVTKLAASASMKYIWTPTVFAATTDELNLISINSATY